jgi:hypothetical protein
MNMELSAVSYQLSVLCDADASFRFLIEDCSGLGPES